MYGSCDASLVDLAHIAFTFVMFRRLQFRSAGRRPAAPAHQRRSRSAPGCPAWSRPASGALALSLVTATSQ